ncbi:MAG: hypothetical protein RJP95_00955 [Pirellulales bacterium]
MGYGIQEHGTLNMHSPGTPNTLQTPPKSGAPKGNVNAIRHGLVAGSLPKKCGYVQRLTKEFRDDLAQAVNEAKGELSITDVCFVDTASRWQRHGLLAQRWLRRESETMSHDQRLAYSREIARAGTERDRCIKQLGLDQSQADALTVAYRNPEDYEPKQKG